MQKSEFETPKKSNTDFSSSSSIFNSSSNQKDMLNKSSNNLPSINSFASHISSSSSNNNNGLFHILPLSTNQSGQFVFQTLGGPPFVNNNAANTGNNSNALPHNILNILQAHFLQQQQFQQQQQQQQQLQAQLQNPLLQQLQQQLQSQQQKQLLLPLSNKSNNTSTSSNNVDAHSKNELKQKILKNSLLEQQAQQSPSSVKTGRFQSLIF